ncbi:MAG: FAD-dependent oxidoreductase, partial [Phycisphaerae bacterium]|nr:FAD-dependent oxidoreductase [Phycisphaerae bacterium]
MAANTSYDMVIVGGGPAGCAAAIAACRKELRTLIIERCDTPEPSACAGWLGPAAARVCQDCGVDAAAAGVKFSGMRLRSW